MGYYQGDFYRGARGDPGFFSFLGGLAKSAVGLIPGVGPSLSSIIGKVGGAVGKRAALPGATGVMARAAQGVGSAIIKHPVLSAAGAAGAVGALGTMGVEHLMAGGGGACPKGFHISKSKHAKHFGMCVRNRRMNVANGRALGRAVRRLHHFARKYRKVVGFVSPRKAKGQMYFKKRKRAA